MLPPPVVTTISWSQGGSFRLSEIKKKDNATQTMTSFDEQKSMTIKV
jgi:hypothetical protein